MPFEDASFTDIYAGHFFEHIPIAEVQDVLREVRRVMKPGGGMVIVGPDIQRATDLDEPQWLLDAINNTAEGRPGDCHKWIPTEKMMLELAEEVFPNAEAVDIAQVGPSWPVVSAARWQFAIVCPFD